MTTVGRVLGARAQCTTRVPGLIAALFATLVLLSLLVRVAFADAVDEESRRIAKRLQCPVCAGASVAESPSELAGQMRAVIRQKVEAGESEPQIVQYFVDRYGDGVLVEPPRRGIGLLVWLAPVAVLVVGGVLLWRLLKSWLRPARLAGLEPLRPAPSAHVNGTGQNGTARASDETTVSSVDRARVELDRFRREA